MCYNSIVRINQLKGVIKMKRKVKIISDYSAKKEVPEIATFETWGSDYEEFDSGAGNFTTAIVSLNDGTVKQLLPTDIQFINEGE